MICMKNLWFSSRPRAKVRRQGPPGSARAQPCFRTTHSGFRNEDAENASVPYMYLEVQEEAPDSNPDGQALEAEPDGLEVEDLRWVLVRVDLTNCEIWLILALMSAHQD